MNNLSVALMFLVIVFAASAEAQTINSHWKKVQPPTSSLDIYKASFAAFDSLNVIWIDTNEAVYYSTNRGEAWHLSQLPVPPPSMNFAGKLDLVDGVALISVIEDWVVYESRDSGRSWLTHYIPAVDTLPTNFSSYLGYPKWYKAGRAWYKRLRSYRDSTTGFDSEEYVDFLQQDTPFGPLVRRNGFRKEVALKDLWDSQDKDTIMTLHSGLDLWVNNGQTIIMLGVNAWPSNAGTYFYEDHIFSIGGSTWLITGEIHTGATDRKAGCVLLSHPPQGERRLFLLPRKMSAITSKPPFVIAAASSSSDDSVGGAFISNDLGKSWSFLSVVTNNKGFGFYADFIIVDSLHIFMRYEDEVYYTEDGGGPSIPLAGVALPMADRSPGVVLEGSNLSIVSITDEVELLNLLGVRVKALKSRIGELTKIDLSPYPDGIYFLRNGTKWSGPTKTDTKSVVFSA